mgnify:CR=1 FL=1
MPWRRERVEMVRRVLLGCFSVGVIAFSPACGGAGPSTEKTTDPAPQAAETTQAAETVQHLRGEAITTSPDGATPYGPPKAILARWVMSAGGDALVEDAWHGADHFRSVFTRRPGGLVYDVADDAKTFNGTVTFAVTPEGAGGDRAAMTYEIRMTDGSGTLTGTAEWEADVLKTDKLFSDGTQTARARIRESLKVITQAEFDAARAGSASP